MLSLLTFDCCLNGQETGRNLSDPRYNEECGKMVAHVKNERGRASHYQN